ncbi:MAG: hypothetical protein JWO99_385 [Candidatus Saccharibacteria bacterium]|nr:hypothetical protein [Candidatus Saccharibacteria bacterium]
MAENHYVDPKDQHIAAEGVPSRTDLTTAYRDAKKETLGPWMQEDERQLIMEKDRQKVITSLRKSSFLIGLYTSLPVVTGILLYDFAIVRATLDQATALILAFVLLLAAAIWAIISYRLFKWIGETFRQHTLRALPITFTTLLILGFLVRPTFMYFTTHFVDTIGQIIWLASLLVIGVAVSIILIFIWTTKWIPGLLKIFILLALFGAAVAVAYLT